MAGTKRKIEIAKRETKSQRSVAFSKRRLGLFKKAADLCVISGASVAVLATPPSDKPDVYSFGNPSADDVVEAFLSGRLPTPPSPENCASVAGTKLGLGLLETQNIDDPEEVRCLIDRLQELRNNVAVLLETREKRSVSHDCSISFCPTLEADGIGEISSDCYFGENSVSDCGLWLPGTECAENSFSHIVSSTVPDNDFSVHSISGDTASRAFQTHFYGGSVSDNTAHIGFSECGQASFGFPGNYNFERNISDCGFSYPGFSFPATYGETTSTTLETPFSGGSVDHNATYTGFSELAVDCGYSGAFENVGFGNALFENGVSSDCTQFAECFDAGIGSTKYSYGGKGDFANQDCDNGISNAGIENSYYGISQHCTVFAEFSNAGTAAHEISYGGSYGDF